MKKVFLIAGLMVAAVIAVAFGSCTNTNTTNQAADNATAEATPVPSSTFTATTPTPTATPTPAATAAEVKNRVYTNEKFGYKITLPAGYMAEVTSTGAPYGQDKVTIKNTAGEEFATIWTPMLEVGAEMWDTVEESDKTVPGSTNTLHAWKGKPTPGSGTADWIVWVTWPGGEDFHKSGLIVFKYLPDQTARLKSFETMVDSLRFL